MLSALLITALLIIFYQVKFCKTIIFSAAKEKRLRAAVEAFQRRKADQPAFEPTTTSNWFGRLFSSMPDKLDVSW